MSAATYPISGLHFSTPYRSILKDQFELLAACGAQEPVLYGKAVWEMDHKQTPTSFTYTAAVEPVPGKVLAVSRNLHTALTDKYVECTPLAPFNALRINFRHNTRPVSVILFHANRPSHADVIAAAPDATAGAIMTRQQEIIVSQGFMDLRHTGQNVVPLHRKAGSHAFNWLYG